MNLEWTSNDWMALSPLLLLLAGALLLLFLTSVFEAAIHRWLLPLGGLFLVAACFAAVYSPTSQHPLLILWLRFDSLSRFFTLFFLLTGLSTLLLSAPFFKQFAAPRGEYLFLLFSALFGLVLIGASADFLTLFLGLETLSISLYLLCGYMKKWEISQEASIKYFLIGSLAAAFFLYGIAWIYGVIGTTQFKGMLAHYHASSSSGQALFLGGIAFVSLGLAFKAALVPFQLWAPDVYAGSSTPITAFMAVGTKAGAFAAFVRLFFEALPQFNHFWTDAMRILAILTLIYANFVALRQVYLRRFFAYSGISHAGFLLIPVVAGTEEALSSLLFYLVIYGLATLGAFAILAFLDDKEEGVLLGDLHGLFHYSPLLAGLLAFCLLTLAGLPPTAGFFAKFYLFKAAFQAGEYALVVIGLLTSVLSAFYYLRIVGGMLAKSPPQARALIPSEPAALLGVLTVAGLLLLSVYPAPLLVWIHQLSDSSKTTENQAFSARVNPLAFIKE